jgi:hypothetical protein
MPCGRWSLFDMMNFSLRSFAIAMRLTTQEIFMAMAHPASDIIATVDKERVTNNLQFIATKCRQLALNSAENRLQRCFGLLTSSLPQTYDELRREFETLHEAIEDDIKAEYFYHYPRPKVMLLILNAEWLPVFDAFPSSRKEVDEGLDCYAPGHPTAAVFHMMRVAELGMRALARERQVTFPKHPLEWADWQNILDLTEKNAKTATGNMSRGPAKDAALAFHNGAIAHLHALKDMYRNSVMHMRRSYDDLDAQRAIGQVRDFMTGLCRKIGEKTKTPIRRWP